MISENSLMQMQPNEMDIVRIPDELPIYDVDDYDMFDEKR